MRSIVFDEKLMCHDILRFQSGILRPKFFRSGKMTGGSLEGGVRHETDLISPASLGVMIGANHDFVGPKMDNNIMVLVTVGAAIEFHGHFSKVQAF